MGHQFAGAVVAAALVAALAACGGSDGDGEPAAVLDIAREQIEVAPPADPADETSVDDAGTTSPEREDEPGEADADVAEPEEFPAPDPSTFEGANRVVNLWVGVDGRTTPIDVWGRRTFTNGPILLADEVAFGDASEYFAAPPGYSLVIVSAGAGPDGEERAGLFNAAGGEQITTIFTNEDERGTVAAPDLFERGSDKSPAPPADGSGLVVLLAPNARAFSDGLIEAVGGDAFYVGDGTSVCRTQRIEATGAAPTILGGTQQVELELPPGRSTISLHPWLSPDECDQPSALDLDVDVVAGETTMVLVFTRDGTGMEALTLPVPAIT